MTSKNLKFNEALEKQRTRLKNLEKYKACVKLLATAPIKEVTQGCFYLTNRTHPDRTTQKEFKRNYSNVISLATYKENHYHANATT